MGLDESSTAQLLALETFDLAKEQEVVKHSILEFGSARQSGISLLTTLVMLILLMIIGVSALRLSKGQLSLAGNLQFQTAAFNEAEAAIATAEKALATTAVYGTGGITAQATGYYPMTSSVDPLGLSWDGTNSIAGANSNQRYLIQQVAKNVAHNENEIDNSHAACNQVNLYRISARGESVRGASKIVQSVFSVLSCKQR